MYDIYQVIEKLGVSKSTAYGWIRQYAQYLTPDPMKDSRKGGSMAMARQYTDHDLRVLLYVKELRKRSWNQREITAELSKRLGGREVHPLPALVDTQATAIPVQPQAPQAPQPSQETPQAPQERDQASIMAQAFPPYGNRAKSAPIDQPAPAQPVIDPPIKVANDPPAIPVQAVIVPFAGELITYSKAPTDHPVPDGVPDDANLIKLLQQESGDLHRIGWGLGIDQQELWKYIVRSRSLRSVYLQARWGHSGGGVTMADLRAAKFG